MLRDLHDPTFSRFDTIPECDRQTHRHTHRQKTTAYTAPSIASRGKNCESRILFVRVTAINVGDPLFSRHSVELCQNKSGYLNAVASLISH